MGCVASKIDTELVKLCKERKELIRSARDSRYSLAFAHMAYLQSMQNVENELKSFMEEALVICFNLASDAGLHHPSVEAVTNSENSSVESIDNEDDDDHLPSNDHVNIVLNPSETQPEKNVSGQVRPSPNFVFPHRNFFSVGVSAYREPISSSLSYYARWEPTNHQMDLSLDSFRPSWNQTLMASSCTRHSMSSFGLNLDTTEATFGSRTDYAVTNSRFFQHERGAPQHYVMDIPSNNTAYYQTHFSYPSSPVQHEVSTWDYINPFNVVEDTFLNFYPQGSYEVSFMSDDMDLGELGEEGIPDLEDELDDPIGKDASGEEYVEMNGDLEECLSEAEALKDENDDYSDQKEVKTTVDGLTNIWNEKNDGSGKEDMESGPSSSASGTVKVKEIKESQTYDGEEDSFHNEMEKSKTCERHHLSSETDESVAELLSKMFVHSSSDLHEVLIEIKDAFVGIIMHGKDVSKMLGSYQPGIALKKGFRCPSCIESLAKDGSESLENETSMTLYNLSLTLEKLCIWENKLHVEVKNALCCKNYRRKVRRSIVIKGSGVKVLLETMVFSHTSTDDGQSMEIYQWMIQKYGN